MKCEHCGNETMKLIIHNAELWCDGCKSETRFQSADAHAVIDDTIIGGFVQEHFGHQPETFYSKSAMLKRAKELGLEPFVRHTDGDKHTSRWV